MPNSEEKITLGGLAFACYLYTAQSGYDSAYRKLLDQTGSAVDLNQETHRSHLLNWLRKWGCRQFATKSNKLASDELRAWNDAFGSTLGSISTNLLSLTDADLTAIERAYDSLRIRIASKKLRSDREGPVKVGPAGAAKILFALRPAALIPWDDPIREHFSLDETGASYCKYLKMGRDWLSDLSSECKQRGFELSDLPNKIGRTRSSVAKLIDEYLWITVSRNCKVPDKTMLQRWVEWS